MDQRGIDDQCPGRERARDTYVSSAEAIAVLGIKPQTLYAYASRGLVRSVPGPRGRPRLYVRADVDRLRARHDARAGHAAVAADALRWGEPVLDSAITEITARGPRTRGVLLVEAAEARRSTEDVADAIWRDVAPPRPWHLDRAQLARSRSALACAARGLAGAGSARPLDALALTNLALGVADAARFVLTPEAEIARARAITLTLAASLALPDLARARAVLESEAGLAARVLAALGAPTDTASRRAVDAILVVLADHELNASTFAARIAASAGADLYACLGAGLATVSGPKHGGACERVEALAGEVRAPRHAPAAVAGRLARGEGLPGFGHPLYPEGDPRALPLLALARALARRSDRPARTRALSRALLATVDHVARCGGEPPSVDTGSVAVTLALGLPAGSSTALFALGRTVGWVAHVLEQRTSAALLRPRARFVG